MGESADFLGRARGWGRPPPPPPPHTFKFLSKDLVIKIVVKRGGGLKCGDSCVYRVINSRRRGACGQRDLFLDFVVYF